MPRRYRLRFVYEKKNCSVSIDTLHIILEAGGDAILSDAGKVTAEFAKKFAEPEFEKYRVIQDRLFSSDFDRFNEGDNLLPFEINPDNE